MDLNYPPEADAFREKVRAFLAENLPAGWKGIGALSHDEADAFRTQWRKVLHEHGYLAVNWPKEYGGGGLTPLESVVLAEEFARAGAPTGGSNDGFGIAMLGNTLLRRHGGQKPLPAASSAVDLAPGLLGACGRQPRQPRPGRAGRRRGDQRPEDLTSAGHATTSSCWPHCSRRGEAPRHHLPAGGHASAGVESADQMMGDSEFNGVLHRRPLPEGQMWSSRPTWRMVHDCSATARAGAEVTGISFRNELDKRGLAKSAATGTVKASPGEGTQGGADALRRLPGADVALQGAARAGRLDRQAVLEQYHGVTELAVDISVRTR